ncbi:hypothetical protein LTR37_006062 [Vermiconidia calcicola]|uniref:Uncharacterized protein n=1 Tax=Vermiconidia calcicola TaxID=1690605 RepID=A0ACC3NHT6_9PEZI|nr:hypothetical protein LTR37_006062 [Vermiconidia calcicola]
MAPRQPEDVSEDDPASNPESGEDSEATVIEPADLLDQVLQDGEQEYHTESEGEDDVDHGAGTGVPWSSAPLLPAELSKPLPSPVHSLQAISIPWEQMTRQQKKAQRNRSRQGKKKAWDRLREEAEGTGVLEAGKAAQMKRGIVASKKEKVRTGRVEKQSKPKTSGRQHMIEQRKRVLLGQSKGEPMALSPARRPKTKSKSKR